MRTAPVRVHTNRFVESARIAANATAADGVPPSIKMHDVTPLALTTNRFGLAAAGGGGAVAATRIVLAPAKVAESAGCCVPTWTSVIWVAGPWTTMIAPSTPLSTTATLPAPSPIRSGRELSVSIEWLLSPSEFAEDVEPSAVNSMVEYVGDVLPSTATRPGVLQVAPAIC